MGLLSNVTKVSAYSPFTNDLQRQCDVGAHCNKKANLTPIEKKKVDSPKSCHLPDKRLRSGLGAKRATAIGDLFCKAYTLRAHMEEL